MELESKVGHEKHNMALLMRRATIILITISCFRNNGAEKRDTRTLPTKGHLALEYGICWLNQIERHESLSTGPRLAERTKNTLSVTIIRNHIPMYCNYYYFLLGFTKIQRTLSKSSALNVEFVSQITKY